MCNIALTRFKSESLFPLDTESLGSIFTNISPLDGKGFDRPVILTQNITCYKRKVLTCSGHKKLKWKKKKKGHVVIEVELEF